MRGRAQVVRVAGRCLGSLVWCSVVCTSQLKFKFQALTPPDLACSIPFQNEWETSIHHSIQNEWRPLAGMLVLLDDDKHVFEGFLLLG